MAHITACVTPYGQVFTVNSWPRALHLPRVYPTRVWTEELASAWAITRIVCVIWCGLVSTVKSCWTPAIQIHVWTMERARFLTTPPLDSSVYVLPQQQIFSVMVCIIFFSVLWNQKEFDLVIYYIISGKKLKLSCRNIIKIFSRSETL